MEIKTKYAVGDTLFYIHDNVVTYQKCQMMVIKKGVTGTFIQYHFDNNRIVDEAKVFLSKAELLKSL